MINKIKRKTAQVTIKNINIVGFELNTTKFNIQNNINSRNIQFKLSGARKLISKTKIISVKTIIEIHYETRQIKNTSICSLTTTIDFELKNFSEVVNKTATKKYAISVDLVQKLISDSISTTRGIMFIKLSGTPLENVILPPVDSSSFLSKKHE